MKLFGREVGLPICAVCRKPVEAIETTEFPDRRSIRFNLLCHGMVDEKWIDECELVAHLEMERALPFSLAPPSDAIRLVYDDVGLMNGRKW